MKGRFFRTILLVLIMILSSAVIFAAGTKESGESTATGPLTEEITLRLGYGDRTGWPEDGNVPDPEHAFALTFKSYVEEATNGQVKIELFGNGILGSNKQMTEMVQSGSLDITIGTGSIGGFFPAFEVFYIPYIFRSEDIATYLFEHSEYWANLMNEMEKETGIKYLAMGPNGVRNFTNNIRPIRSPEDLDGMKIRVMESPVYVKMLNAMGANATPIAWPEVYTSLQTGVVDGQENPVSAINYGKLYEVQKYLTLDAHVWSENVMVMNSDKFISLPAETQHIFKIAALHGSRANAVAEMFMSKIVAYETVVANMEVYKPTLDELKAFQEIAAPPVIEYLKENLGAKTVDSFLAAVIEAEEALGYR